MFAFFFLIINSTNGQLTKDVNVDVQAQYVDGGTAGFQKFISTNIITPNSVNLFEAEGNLIVTFTIDSMGNNHIENFKNTIVFKGNLPDSKQQLFVNFCKNDIKRVFVKMPKWIPAVKGGVKTNSTVEYSVFYSTR